MGANSEIQWTVHTACPWWGCTEVHAGCDRCYARTFAKSVGKGDAWEGVRYAGKSIWANLKAWQKSAAKAGEIHRVFCASMMDIFEKSLPATDWTTKQLIPGVTTGDLRDRYFREVVPATPNLYHLLLTKRPSNILKMVPAEWLAPGGWPANVMTGTSPVDQATANTLVPQLIDVPGPHFLSMEPLLGPVDLGRVHYQEMPLGVLVNGGPVLGKVIQWVILGGESGPGARRCELDWIRDIVRQCRDAGISPFVKQLGACAIDERNGVAGKSLKVHPDAIALVSNRLKDGHGGEWDEWPDDLRIREIPTVEAR